MTSNRVAQAVVTHLGPGGYHHSPKNQRSFPSDGPVIKTGVAALDEIREFPVRLGQLVEVVGGSRSGKTQLLHLIAAHALANKTTESGAKVCWFDLNGGLDSLRIRQLTELAARRNPLHEGEFSADLPGLRVYHPDSTPALCAVLCQLPEFLQSPDGAGGKSPEGSTILSRFPNIRHLLTNRNKCYKVDTIIIDSLGTFHYLDKQAADCAKDNPRSFSPLSNELILTRIVSDILRGNKITAYVSRCALFGEETLSASWPFPEAGVPSIPRAFMPSMWGSIVSHVLLIYHVQQNDEIYVSSSRRAVLSLGPKQGSTSQNLVVHAAGTVVIQREGISASSDVHVVS